MASQYSPKKFFRKISNEYLNMYFESKNITVDFDLNALAEYEVNVIFNFYRSLHEDIRRVVEADFQIINSLASEGGIIALIDEAKEHGNIEFVEVISEIAGFHNKSMWAYLTNPDYWNGASLYFQADSVAPTTWRKIKNLPPATHPVSDINIEMLSKAISDHFHLNEGRGKHCKIEYYKRGDLEYFCAFPEDFAKSSTEWVSSILQDSTHTMAFEIIMVYNPHNATLDMYAKNNAKAIPKLQALFAENILQAPLPEAGLIDKRIYNLDVLAEADFEFVIPDKSLILTVSIVEARSNSKVDPKSYITVGESATSNKNAVHKQLNALNLIIPNRYISQVTLRVVFYPSRTEKTRSKKFKITQPNSCALGYMGDDLVIRKMLSASGIEPQTMASPQLDFECM
ncbi:MAG: hypothetical protein ACI9ES_001542 [Oceanospirillaceae bacterium]|jgi:hypothetical protein